MNIDIGTTPGLSRSPAVAMRIKGREAVPLSILSEITYRCDTCCAETTRIMHEELTR